MASNCAQYATRSGCQGCPYVSIWESKRRSQTVGYAVVCDHPDYEKMLGRLLVRREVFGSRDEAEPPTRRPGFCPLEKKRREIQWPEN